MYPSNSILGLQNGALQTGDIIYNERTMQETKTLFNTSLMELFYNA